MNKIVIGSDMGSYSFTTGTRNITIAGLPYTLTTEQLAYVFNITQDELLHAPAKNLNLATVSGGVISYDSSLPVLASGDVLHIQVWAPALAYDMDMGANVVYVLNSDAAHGTDPESLASETNAAAATYRYVIPFQEYVNLALHWDLVGSATDTVTMTFWATLKEDADDTADTDWVDISTTFFGGAASKASSSTTAEEDISWIDTNMVALKYMVKVVVTGGTTNSFDLLVMKK